jgi:hypothetical protein
MLDILNREILPCVYNFEKSLSELIVNKTSLKIDSIVEKNVLINVSKLLKEVTVAKQSLLNSLDKVRNIND